ncbi:MFS transporter [Rouxiella chamberiensis]|uniref:MFS transporter n=1 Tax=Rouxiella chamberiensis TaxID=1513468 RepID=A0ABY7HTR2_9GAMM|nr:MFS transporter [Rouxiella chamberiensis]WAT02424.1 MFS transporter [Rouxiella chamberiensis]
MSQCSTLGAEPTTSSLKRWLGVLSLAFGTFALVNTEFLPIGLLSPIAHALNVSEGQAGWAIMLPGLIAAIAAPLIMLLARQLNRKTLLLILTGCIILSNAIAMMAHTFPALLLGRLILGFGVGGFWAFAIPAGRRLVSEAQSARAISLISAGVAVGTVAGVPAGAFIGELFGWRMAFTANTVLAIGVFIFQWLALPSLPAKNSLGLGSLLTVAKIKGVRRGLIIGIFMAAAQFSAYTYLEPWLRFQVRLSASDISLLLMGYGIAGLAGTFLTEITVREFGVKRAFLGNILMLALSVLIASQLSSNVAAASTLVVIWGLAFGALPVCLNIWIYQASPALFESGSALMVSVFQIALACGAFFGGMLADTQGTSAAFILGGVLALLAGLSIFISRPQYKQDPA